MTDKIPLIAVCGPTASGKTSLAIELAIALDGEVVSCDSMQVYRGMNIGTAKPDESEMRGIRHHLLDVCDPGESFCVNDYTELASRAIGDIVSRGRRAILCGGTGLYLDTLLRSAPLCPPVPARVRESLAEKSDAELFETLCRVDPVSAKSTHKNNRRRVIRALEIFEGTGRTKSEWDALSRAKESDYDCTLIGLDYSERAVLYKRIDCRVEAMFDAGLLEEVRSLGLLSDSSAGQAIGYKEVGAYLAGTATLAETREAVARATRRYAKRQLTWFRREEGIRWHYPDIEPDFVNNILNDLTKH